VNPARVVIKKYGNRRLYDTSASRYVNLDEIATMIRQGADVQVLDAKTGEDLTRVTLTQVIVEDARDQKTALPLELLKQLILTSDHVGRDFITWYLKSAVDTYQKVQSAVQSGITEVRSAALSPLETMRGFIQQSITPQASSSQSELEELRRRVAELEALQQKPGKKVRKRKQS
jgi:polyhydroxyalkanoate synthesis repressor PhaR